MSVFHDKFPFNIQTRAIKSPDNAAFPFETVFTGFIVIFHKIFFGNNLMCTILLENRQRAKIQSRIR